MFVRLYESHFERLEIRFIFLFWSTSLLLDPAAFTIRIQIQVQNSQIKADPDPKHSKKRITVREKDLNFNIITSHKVWRTGGINLSAYYIFKAPFQSLRKSVS
jgi:hypothetical protein